MLLYVTVVIEPIRMKSDIGRASIRFVSQGTS